MLKFLFCHHYSSCLDGMCLQSSVCVCVGGFTNLNLKIPREAGHKKKNLMHLFSFLSDTVVTFCLFENET